MSLMADITCQGRAGSPGSASWVLPSALHTKFHVAIGFWLLLYSWSLRVYSVSGSIRTHEPGLPKQSALDLTRMPGGWPPAGHGSEGALVLVVVQSMGPAPPAAREDTLTGLIYLGQVWRAQQQILKAGRSRCLLRRPEGLCCAREGGVRGTLPGDNGAHGPYLSQLTGRPGHQFSFLF